MTKQAKQVKQRSNFTYSESQAITTIEVTVLIAVAFALWFADWRFTAVAMLLWATASLLAHFNRRYKDDK